jgi:hypothetical protein
MFLRPNDWLYNAIQIVKSLIYIFCFEVAKNNALVAALEFFIFLYYTTLYVSFTLSIIIYTFLSLYMENILFLYFIN